MEVVVVAAYISSVLSAVVFSCNSLQWSTLHRLHSPDLGFQSVNVGHGVFQEHKPP